MTGDLRRLVLVGGGHSHAQVLDDWIRRPIPGVSLTVVTPEPRSPYSGMVPGWLAGLYDYDEICIDVASLTARAGATFVADSMTGLDAARRRVLLAGGNAIEYDVLSLDVGSTLDAPGIDGALVLPLRPLSRLRERWDAALAGADEAAPIEIVGVGGGAAGFEALLALRERLTRDRPRRALRATLATSGPDVVPTLARGASRRARRVLDRRDVALSTGTTHDAATLAANDGRDRIVLWATGARAHRWQTETGLAVDASGWLRVDDRLRSTSHAEVFASGDCAAFAPPLPKAGVYAVRMGPVLVHNLRASLGVGRLRAYRPQRWHLVLLSTGDRRAIASWGPLACEGRWVWRWKDRIDRRFVDRFNRVSSTRHHLVPAPRSKGSP